ncbi:GNAT family N-acetyltransferase [Vibrio ostreicida]|uniref:GNAT family protein n=1 Tax=Vibrio ostreicida TaxID=526588 RepID=A0ABT8C018_9VIBR|nr:GNAT family protein [Vibrio ostreicida]MDN3611707.1 GNAT family protein [Vibrio ostreicida]NPD10098.1 GNAT family N-acetyltransferase [Vibrio ostreicida]
MQLVLLKKSDVEKLLEFELDNRAWFEQNIPAREIGFYSKQGVRKHIQLFLDEYRQKSMIPMLIVNTSGDILGRINVSEINRKKSVAYLGYRVGKKSINQGVAKFAVASIIGILEKIGIQRLVAFASTENQASQNVLLSSGFTPGKVVKKYAQMNNKSVDCIEFQLLLS